jgi:hypothetical protein
LVLCSAFAALLLASSLVFNPATQRLGEASAQEMPARARLGTPFQLAFNETVAVAGSDISVHFLNVTEDSRCPSDVTCIWAGQVSVMLGVTQNSTGLGNFTLTLGDNSSRAEHRVGAYVIKLTEVRPYPVSTQPTEQSDYTATLTVSKDDGGALMLRSVLVKAVANSSAKGPAITGLISAWSIERESGTAIFVIRDENMLPARVVARFLPLDAECVREEMSECLDGQITSISGNAGVGQGDFIHYEIDDSRGKIHVSFKTPMTNQTGASGEAAEYGLDIRKFKEVHRPYTPQNGNATMVTLREGEREGPLLVQRIYPDRVEGLNYPEYPVAMDKGLPITLRVGEKASNGCTVFLTLAKIEGGSATFVKKVDESRPCPICWAQMQFMSGWS